MAADKPLAGWVALVAGATRGAGGRSLSNSPEPARTCTRPGRSSRTHGRSKIDRPETIEETGDLIRAAGGEGTAVRVDHL